MDERFHELSEKIFKYVIEQVEESTSDDFELADILSDIQYQIDGYLEGLYLGMGYHP